MSVPKYRVQDPGVDLTDTEEQLTGEIAEIIYAEVELDYGYESGDAYITMQHWAARRIVGYLKKNGMLNVHSEGSSLQA